VDRIGGSTQKTHQNYLAELGRSAGFDVTGHGYRDEIKNPSMNPFKIKLYSLSTSFLSQAALEQIEDKKKVSVAKKWPTLIKVQDGFIFHGKDSHKSIW